MIETPADGTLMLTWQPLEYLGTNFASDGFIWADAEHVFKSEVRGYVGDLPFGEATIAKSLQTLEMFLQRSGYRAQGEAMASHSRRRYRLLPGNPNLGLPNPDPSLWLTHYSKASARDHVPAASIPIMPHIHAQLQQRRMIQSQGQLPRKEFMLLERPTWPTIHLPAAMARAGAPTQLPPAAGHRKGTSIAQESTLEEEEDVSRGDLLDFMTPRDISRMRYEQHHEWMEEIIGSPYPTLSIIPSDLGLGRKGQLEELTKDFFDAPISAMREPSNGPPPRVGKMADGRADDFAKRASEKLASMQAELESMRKRHARRMEKLHRSATLVAAEKRLRTAPNAMERRSLSNGAGEEGTDVKPRDAVDEIMVAVESDMGQKLHKTTSITLVSKGGMEERAKLTPVTVEPPAPTVTSPTKAVTSPISTKEAVSQQEPAQQTVTATERKSEEKETSTTSGEKQTNANTETDPMPSEAQLGPSGETNQVPEADTNQQTTELPQLDEISGDANMGGLDDDLGDSGNQSGNEWVMIGEDGDQHVEEMQLPDVAAGTQQHQNQATADEDTARPTGETSNLAQQPQHQLDHDTPLDTPDFDMGGDFNNVDMDTAGDALASYGNEDDDLNLDNMEDSAFGDAFHPDEDEDIA